MYAFLPCTICRQLQSAQLICSTLCAVRMGVQCQRLLIEYAAGGVVVGLARASTHVGICVSEYETHPKIPFASRCPSSCLPGSPMCS